MACDSDRRTAVRTVIVKTEIRISFSKRPYGTFLKLFVSCHSVFIQTKGSCYAIKKVGCGAAVLTVKTDR